MEKRRNRNSNGGIGFVDLANRSHPQARLADSAAIDEPGAAAVASSRIDLVELDHSVARRRPGDDQDQDDDHDRDCLEENASAHPHL